MLIRLLGPVGLLDHGTTISLPGERRLSLLACLALQHGEQVSVDRLVDAVWGEDPPATARNTIQSHVAYLRKALGGAVLVHRPPGYVLTLEQPATDVAVVDTLLTRVREADTPAERLPLLQEALSWWRGPSLQGVGSSAYLARHALVLDERRLEVLERAYADRLRLGQHREVVGPLRGELAEHPVDERLARLLMVGLYRCGLRDEALRVFDELGVALRRELDVEPSGSLVRLRARIVARDAGLLVPAGAATAASAGPGAPAPAPRATARRPAPSSGRQWLPGAARSRIVGRADDLAAGREALSRGRLLTIVGQGGVGKTRLAAEVMAGASVEHHVVVDLTEAMGHRAVAVAATALSVELTDETDPLAAVVAAFPQGASIVVLDNCEADIAGAGDLAAALLDERPESLVVATSTEPLHLDGEECLILRPLRPPEEHEPPLDSPAVQMVLARAEAADPGFSVSGAALEDLAAVCRDVEGLPLALEIVAARLRSMTPAEVREAISSRLLSWRDPRRAVQPHHRSMGSLMEWTYSLLDEREAEALDRLGQLRGGAWLAEAAALCGNDAGHGEELLHRLVDRSLVDRVEVAGRTRIGLHGLVRAYATQRLLEDPARGTALASRHAHWVADVVQDWYARQHARDELVLLRCRRLDEGNLTAALEWAASHEPDLLARLVAMLWWYWYRSSQAADGLRWARRALAVGGTDPEVMSRVRAAAGYLAWLVDQYDEAAGWADEALATPAATERTRAFAHGVLARAVGDSGRFDEAADHARRSVAAYETAGDAWGAAWSRRLLATALYWGGRVTDSEEPCSRALAEFEALGDLWGVAGTLDLLARIEHHHDRPEAALDLGLRALQANRDCGDTSGERYALQQLAQTSWDLRRLDRAEELATASLALSEEHGYLAGALQALQLLEDVERARGDPHAERRAEQAAAVAQRLGPVAAEVSLAIAAERRAMAPAPDSSSPPAPGSSSPRAPGSSSPPAPGEGSGPAEASVLPSGPT